MLRVPDARCHRSHRARPGRSRFGVTAGGEVRVGWVDAEPDWLGPGPVIAPDGIAGTVHATRGRAGGRAAPGSDGGVSTVSRPATSRRPRSRGTSNRAGGPPAAHPKISARSVISTPSSRCRCSATRRCRVGGCCRSGPRSSCRSDSSRPTAARCCSRRCSRFTSRSSACPRARRTPTPGCAWVGTATSTTSPAGFATELAIIAGDGARDCYDRWARLLRADVRCRGARARFRHARNAALVLDRQRQRVLVPHRTRARRRFDDRRRGRRPRSARSSRRLGAARLVVVPARGTAPVQHRRVGRAAVGHGALGTARPTCCPTASPRCANGSVGGR